MLTSANLQSYAGIQISDNTTIHHSLWNSFFTLKDMQLVVNSENRISQIDNQP